MENNFKYEPIHTTADWDVNFKMPPIYNFKILIREFLEQCKYETWVEKNKTNFINSPTINSSSIIAPNVNMGDIKNNEDKEN